MESEIHRGAGTRCFSPLVIKWGGGPRLGSVTLGSTVAPGVTSVDPGWLRVKRWGGDLTWSFYCTGALLVQGNAWLRLICLGLWEFNLQTCDENRCNFISLYASSDPTQPFACATCAMVEIILPRLVFAALCILAA